MGGWCSQEEQAGNAGSVYNFYRQVIAIRNHLPVVARGISSAEDALNQNCVSAFRKVWNDESCIILININAEAASVDLSGYEDWSLAASVSADGNPVSCEANQLQLPAFAVAVLIPQ